MGGTGPIPDSKSLESLVEHLKSLSQMADARGDTCNMGIRELSRKRKDVGEEPEPIDREATRMKREIDEDDDVVQPTKGGKLKKRKERGGSVKEERPLNHGAHELSRQDGAETKIEGGKSINLYGSFSNTLSHHTNLSSGFAGLEEVQECGIGRHLFAFPSFSRISHTRCHKYDCL